MMFLWALTIISVLAMVPLQSLDLPRKSCSSYCSGSYKTGAKCVNGFCECSKPGYNKYTCLPEVGNCRVIPNNPDAVAAATLKNVTQAVRSCLNTDDVHRYQVHVLAVYEGDVHTRPPTAGTTHVHVEGVGDKPVVLALSSYEPVRWVIHVSRDVQLHAVLMFSYYNTISSVDLSHVVNSTSVLVEKTRRSSAIGDDSGGGDTVGLMKLLNAGWGPIKSFSGCYKADHWTLTVSKPKATASEQPTSTSTPVESCLESKDCWVKYNFLFEDNWNDCHGDQYVKKTKYQVGKYVGVVLCSANKYKLFLSDSLTDRFLNIADGSGHGQDHCEFIGRTTDAKSIDNDFWNSPATTGYSRSFRGKTPTIGRIGGGTGSTWTGQYYYKWIKCGVSIPGDSRVVTWTGAEDKTPQPPTGEPEPTLKPDKTPQPPTGEPEPEPTLKPDKTPQPPTGEPEPEPTLKPVLPRKSCSSYCSGSYKTGAKCVNGFCECSQPGYNKYTCLPEVGNCRVIPNNPDAVAAATLKSVTQTVRSCLNTDNVHRYQVHVLGVYEGDVHTRPPTAGTTHVYIEGVGEKPVVLALSSHEPVRWVIHAGRDVQLHAVFVTSYYNTISSVDLSHVINSKSVLVEASGRSSAIGDDSGGGDTVGLIKLLNARWGTIKSFSGTYTTDRWTLTISKPQTQITETPTTTTTSTSKPKPATRCLGSYCPGSYVTGAKCVNGYCVCSSPGYNHLTCLPEYAGCSIEQTKEPKAVPSFNGKRLSSTYSCISEHGLTLSPEVHVLGCYENLNRRPPRAAVTTVDIQGNTTRPVVLVLSTYEPVAWTINVPAGVIIQKIIVFAYYADQSSVTVNGGSSPPVEKSRDIACAYGSDNGGCHTLKLLKKVKSLFGHVTSFSGTYKVDHWSLKVGG